MEYLPQQPPRTFDVGYHQVIRLQDCGRIRMAPDEQVTFLTDQGAEYDVVRKDWGFYATPSMNGRLASFGLRAVLVKSPRGKFYLMLVERGKEPAFHAYLDGERHTVASWLDTDEACAALERRVPAAGAGA